MFVICCLDIGCIDEFVLTDVVVEIRFFTELLDT